MNDIMYLYFDFDQKDQQAVDAIEKLLPGVDALLKGNIPDFRICTAR